MPQTARFKQDGFEHFRLGNFPGAAFDHHDGLLGAGDLAFNLNR